MLKQHQRNVTVAMQSRQNVKLLARAEQEKTAREERELVREAELEMQHRYRVVCLLLIAAPALLICLVSGLQPSFPKEESRLFQRAHKQFCNIDNDNKLNLAELEAALQWLATQGYPSSLPADAERIFYSHNIGHDPDGSRDQLLGEFEFVTGMQSEMTWMGSGRRAVSLFLKNLFDDLSIGQMLRRGKEASGPFLLPIVALLCLWGGLTLLRDTNHLLGDRMAKRPLCAAVLLFLASFVLSLWLEEDIQGMRVLIQSSMIFGTVWVIAILTFLGGQTQTFQAHFRELWHPRGPPARASSAAAKA